MAKLFHLGIHIGLILLSIGLIGKATIWLHAEAYKSVKSGLIRIHPINQSLVRK